MITLGIETLYCHEVTQNNAFWFFKIFFGLQWFEVAESGLGKKHFISQADNVFIVLIVLILCYTEEHLLNYSAKSKILVRPWPDLPGWFPQPCEYLASDM